MIKALGKMASMKPPLVTVITPTFNHGSFIQGCIDSVLAQTYQNWEQIIVDDFSSDNTTTVISSYKDPRIRLIKKAVHGGIDDLFNSYNMALEAAHGELVAILEGDDFWPKEKLTRQIPFHKDKRVVLSWGACYKHSNGVIKKTRLRHGPFRRKFPDTSRLLVRNPIPAVTVVASRSALREVGGFWQPSSAVFVDHPTWLKLSTIGDILYLPYRLGVYRIHKDQVSEVNKSRMGGAAQKYQLEFIATLNMEKAKKINQRHLYAQRDGWFADEALLRGDYDQYWQLLGKAICGGDFQTKYGCVLSFLRRIALGVKGRLRGE